MGGASRFRRPTGWESRAGPATARLIAFFVLLLALEAVPVRAEFEQDMPNLRVPTNLKSYQLMVDIQHRFLPQFAAANVTLGMRYLVWSKLEVNGGYTWYHYSPRDNARDEGYFGVSYAVYLPKIARVEPEIEFFSFDKALPPRRQNLYYQLALESYPILDVLKPVVNVGYDGYDQGFGLGAGLNASFKVALGPVQRIDVAGEYFPRLNQDMSVTGMSNAFDAALTFETYGHHFMFVFGNGLEAGPRRLMLGAQSNKLYFGFNVHRFLDLKTL